MSYSEILAISKMGGLYQMVKKRTDGLIVKGLLDEKQTFVSSRNHDFTPLENITIYTEDDHIELRDILNVMKGKCKECTVPSPKAPNPELKSYFEEIVPDYDKERVYVSDVSKIIKWYNVLEEAKYLPIKSKEEVEKEASKAEKKATKKTTKKTKATTKATKKASASKK